MVIKTCVFEKRREAGEEGYYDGAGGPGSADEEEVFRGLYG